MKATYVGHATVLVELDGVRLLTDPVLRGRVGPLRRHGAKVAAAVAESLDAVLVSHLHHDHADLPSLRRLGTGTPILAPRGGGTFFARHGFERVAELGVGESSAVGDVSVQAVEAVHDAGEGRFARGGEAIGFLIEGSRRVYFAGDTDLYPGMAGIGPDLDLALLPIWGWGPNIGPGHMNPERAARATVLLEPRVVVPIHWGTLYPLGLRPLRPSPLRSPGPAFAARVRELAPQVEVRVLSPGESLSLA